MLSLSVVVIYCFIQIPLTQAAHIEYIRIETESRNEMEAEERRKQREGKREGVRKGKREGRNGKEEG